MWNVTICKSASLSGWKYFIMWEDLGSGPMYAILCVIKLVLFLNIY